MPVASNLIKPPLTWADEPTKTTPINAARLEYAEKRATELAEQMIRCGAVTPQNFGAKGNGEADDTAAMQTFFNECKEAAGVIPPGVYKTKSALSVPAEAEVFGINQHSCRLLREGNGDTLDLQEGGQTLANFRLDCVAPQASGNMVELQGAGGTDVRIEDLAFGSNFFNVFSLIPTGLGGSIHLRRIRGIGLTSALQNIGGTVFILGNLANRLVGATLEDIQVQGEKASSIKAMLKANNHDSTSLTNCLFQTATNGVMLGDEGAAENTNLVATNVVCDGGAEGMLGWFITNHYSVDLTGCHGQGAEMYIGEGNHGGTMTGGTLQVCRNNGLRLGGAGAGNFEFLGTKIGNNNVTLPAGTATNAEGSPFSADVLVENGATNAIFTACLMGAVFMYGGTCRSYYPFWFGQTSKTGNGKRIYNNGSVWCKGGNNTKAFTKNEFKESEATNVILGFASGTPMVIPAIFE